MGNRQNIAKYLKEIRLQKKLSKGKIAREGKIRPCQVTDIESGEKNYTIDSLLGYLNGIGMDITFTNQE
ncbi:hypothetical protein EZS27_003565 [termite gut metagenome]|uniref:Uncharacterized protein n=1 Tax=termite gut metagenome TaxID=433724 RepID=A0A5J4SUU1_9ZZZZ